MLEPKLSSSPSCLGTRRFVCIGEGNELYTGLRVLYMTRRMCSVALIYQIYLYAQFYHVYSLASLALGHNQ